MAQDFLFVSVCIVVAEDCHLSGCWEFIHLRLLDLGSLVGSLFLSLSHRVTNILCSPLHYSTHMWQYKGCHSLVPQY